VATAENRTLTPSVNQISYGEQYGILTPEVGLDCDRPSDPHFSPGWLFAPRSSGSTRELTSLPRSRRGPRPGRSLPGGWRKSPVGHQNAVCQKSQAAAHGISRPGDAFDYVRSTDVYARSRGDRLRPGLVRAAPQTCSGGRCSSPAARCLETETAPSQIAPPRSAVLDCAPPALVWLGRGANHCETGNRRLLASCRIPVVLAVAVEVLSTRTTEGQRGDSPVDSPHEGGQFNLGCSSYSWGIAPSRVRNFRADRLALSSGAKTSLS
jgi:hypothetical protein